MDVKPQCISDEPPDLSGAQTGAAIVSDDGGFDNAGYLLINPDVADAIQRGDYHSGYQHYVVHGFREGRPCSGRPENARNVLLSSPASALGKSEPAAPRACGFELLTLSACGGLMLVGWLDDAGSKLDCIRIVGPSWQIVIDACKVVRLRRPDVEEVLGLPPRHLHGLVAFMWTERMDGLDGPCVIEYWMVNGQTRTHAITPQQVHDIEQRNTLLTYLSTAGFLGNAAVEAMAAISTGLGSEIVAANRALTTHAKSKPYVERFGQKARVPQGSIIVVLYGKPEFMFLQHALYSGLPGIEDYEFVFVSNSPEIAETLLREARRSDLIYGASQTIVVLSGNAGFGAANNVGAAYARSKRLLIINPDVFPRDADWARKHTALLGAVKAEECRLFGVPMYYDDGSLMHGGLYFEVDQGLSFSEGVPRVLPMVRVEHYGKGAPPESARYLRPRPVPAVGGAFISCSRLWFETLDGFTEDYVFGHYEDADLCLKSLERGTPAWLHDIRMWHLEGKGSIRMAPHEGGSMINRWLFSQRWGELIGESPARPVAVSSTAQSRPQARAANTVARRFGCADWDQRARAGRIGCVPIASGPARVKVLLLSLFHPELVRGGAQQVAYELFEGLRAQPGIEPVLLCAIDPSHSVFYKSGARITGFDGRPNEFLFLSRDYDYTWHKAGDSTLLEAYTEFLRLVSPDVVHIHHFLLFGLDIITLTRRVLPDTRIVFTFHEFMSICAADGHMLRRNDGTLCTRASAVRCNQCFPDQNPEHFFVREMWVKKHLAAADVFTTPSRFMIEHYVNWGLPREKIIHITNGQRDYSKGARRPEMRERRNRFGFFGQLVDVKGVWLLLEAVQILRAEGFNHIALEINGDNLNYASMTRRAEFEAFMVAEAMLPYHKRCVVFNGSYSVDQLASRMARIDWVVWYQACGGKFSV